jgi:hypothetical protein
MSLVLQSSGGGQITIQEPTTASNFTQTLPAATGTVMVSGNQPAFAAYQTSAQTITTGTFNKINFQTEEYDTNSNFASSSFTPTVAGYYQINACISVNGGVTAGEFLASIMVNGNEYKRGVDLIAPAYQVTVSAIVYLNGSTDFLDIYAYQNSGSSKSLNTGIYSTWVNGAMIRAA